MNFETIKTLIAESAKALGVTEYEIYESSVEGMSAQVLGDEVSGMKSFVKGGVCVRCAKDGKMGYASTQLFEEAEIRELLSRALENAENTEKEDTVGIFSGSEHYNKPEKKEFTPFTPAEITQTALALQKATYAASDKVVKGTRANAHTTRVSEHLYNSYGLDLASEGGLNYMYAMPVVTDQNESVNAFHMGVQGKDTIEEIAKKAVDSALSKLGAGLVKTGKYNIVIDAEEMASLLAVFAGGFTAKAVQMGTSRLAGKEGQKIAADIVTITDDPAREGSYFPTYFDAEGVATYRKDVVKNGVLETLLYNRETAKKAGKTSTGNASKASYAAAIETSPHTFCIEAGEHTKEALFEMAGDGLYITEVKGLHAGANAVTGDFSVESAGYLLKDGKKTSPVKSFTIAGNFFELLLNIEALGSDLYIDFAGSPFGSPSVLLKDISVAGE